MILSEKDPEALYPYFDRLLPYLTHENNILRYGMIVILSNLSVVKEKLVLKDL